MGDHPKLSRRAMLAGLGAAITLLALPFRPIRRLHQALAYAARRLEGLKTRGFSLISPIDRTIALVSQDGFSGDQPQARAHPVLWSKPSRDEIAFAPSEKAPLVIIGGGMSGLITAYLLRAHRPIVLEQASQLGGNAK